MKKRNLASFIAALLLTLLVSAESWEGNAMAGSYGDFPSSGYYAASNSFSRNTSVEIFNPENGKSVNVIITKGLDTPGIFLMLSSEAASAIGLFPGKIIQLKASAPKSPVELAPLSQGSSFDPDLNPKMLAAQELKRLGYDLKPETASGVVAKPAISETRVEPAGPKSLDLTTPEPLPPRQAEKPAVSDKKELLPRIAEIPQDAKAKTEVSSGAAQISGAEQLLEMDKAPQPLVSSKIKPVRTIILPELPEPKLIETETGSKEPYVPEELAEKSGTKPEVYASLLPVPDEAPLRVDNPMAPRRYEAPSILPDVLDYNRQAKLAVPEYFSLPEPEYTDRSAAAAKANEKASPDAQNVEMAVELGIPIAPEQSRAVVIDRAVPHLAKDRVLAELAWPELEADEIPEIVLAGLAAPAEAIPATSLAEGEVILSDPQKPKAIAIESPQFDAAETQIALADAQPISEEKPLVETVPALQAQAGSVDAAIAEAEEAGMPESHAEYASAPANGMEGQAVAEAQEQKPKSTMKIEDPKESTPDLALNLPPDYEISMEPTTPKPPSPAKDAVIPPISKELNSGVAEPAHTSYSFKLVSDLEKGKYYIQLGAYASQTLSFENASKLGLAYPAIIQSVKSSGKESWKLYVGPLSRDESGLMLVKVRAMGFKDAFVKSAN